MKRLAIGAGLMALAAGLGAAPGGGAGAGAAPSGLVINVMSLKAVADGTTDCSAAIESAIAQAAAKGGGTVEFPAGTYLTGRIKLQSNITLQIDEGATLKFSTDRSKYPLERTRYECTDIMNYSPLIYAYQCKNIAIKGKGTIDGQGAVWWEWARTAGRQQPAGAEQTGPEQPGGNSGQGVGGSVSSRNLMLMYTNDRAGKYPIEERVFGDKHPGFRPTFVEPYECDGVTIEGITVKESPFWNIHPLYSKNITVRNVTVIGDGPNTDGCDPDSSTDMLVEGCTFTTGDDCIAIKSGRDGDGLRVNRPTENLTIRNCVMKGGHGAVAIGSETSGSIRHVLVENCQFDGPDSGVRIKSTRGRGGVVEDITFKNCTIDNTKKYPITLDMRYANPRDTSTAPVSETTPVFRNITLEDLKCTGAPQAMWVVGLPESPIENLVMKNVTITADKGAHLEYVKGFVRENVTVTPKEGEAWMMKDVTEGK